MKHVSAEIPVRPAMIWDLLIRVSGTGLFLLLVVAYATGEEFQHTHALIGYSIAGLLVVGLFWISIRPHHARFPQIAYSPHALKQQFQRAGKVPNALASTVLILGALPLCALILMVLTHTIWGTTWIDEMHEVVAYFVVGLVAVFIAMVAIASCEHVEYHFRNLFGGNKHPF